MLTKTILGLLLFFQVASPAANVVPLPTTVKVIALTADETALVANTTTQAEVDKIVGYLQIKYLLDSDTWNYKVGWTNGFTFSDDYKYIVSNQLEADLTNPPGSIVPNPAPATHMPTAAEIQAAAAAAGAPK